MSAHDEEQLNEMEAMDAIYAADYQLVKKDVPREYALTLTPHTDGTESHGQRVQPALSCRLQVQYPPDYPAVSPVLSVHSLLGLSKSQLAHLTALATSEAAGSVGSECVMQVATAVRDWLVEHNHPQRSMFDDLQGSQGAAADEGPAEAGSPSDDENEPEAQRIARREKRDAERRAMRGPSPLGIPPGTVVTVASFLSWKVRFDEEQRRLKEDEEKKAACKEQRMTGKQLFLANLARELQDDEAEALAEEKEEHAQKDSKLFWFSEGVYADEDVDLPDDDEDDDGHPPPQPIEQQDAEEVRHRAEEDRKAQAAATPADEEKRRKANEQTDKPQKSKPSPPPPKAKKAPPAASGKGKDAGKKGKK